MTISKVDFTPLREAQDFWKSLQGLHQRLELLGEDFVFGMQNNALQLLASDNNCAVEWIGYTDAKTCDYCDSQIGRQYRVGQFIPRLPAHPHCRCSWRLIRKP